LVREPAGFSLRSSVTDSAEREVTHFLGDVVVERTPLLCLEYCVVEFGAGDVGVPLASWHVTP
jgi:hypothetical protein